VLVAEDEAAVRSVVERVLSAAGYTVLSAASGEEAISAMRERGGAVDLVVSDVIMPGMGGPELAARLRAKWPSVRILFTSGYSADEFGESRTPDVPLLPKPFAPEALLAAVAAAIRGS
jgi:two-component system cell cycle sensor histidine kinase/response regulator CckA